MSEQKKKKLLFVTTSLGSGGAERVLYLLCENLNSRIDIKVITLSSGAYSRKLEKLGIEVLTVKFSSVIKFLVSVFKSVKLIVKFKPTLIQGWMYHGNIFAHFVRLFSPKSKLYLGIRQSLPNIKLEKKCTQIIIKLDSFLSRFADLVIYNSFKGQKDHLTFGYNTHDVVIPNGVDTDKFKPSSSAKKELCQKLKIPDNSILIGMIARFHPVKDHATFFKAAAEFSKSNSKAHFILVGQDINTKNEVLKSIISKYSEIKEKVHLLGVVDDVENVISALDIAVNCSLSEGMPNNVIEAMASGAIVTATDVGDSKIIIDNEKLMVATGSSSSLCHVWQDVLKQDMSNVSNKLVQRVKEKFSLSSMISNFAKLYTNA